MLVQSLPHTVELDVDRVRGHAVGAGEIGHLVEIPVAAQEQGAVGGGELPQKIVQRLGQGGVILGGVGGNGGQLVQRLGHVDISLGPPHGAVAVDGEVAHQPPQIILEGEGLLGRDGLPCLQVGVVDTLLGIGLALQNLHRDGVDVAPVAAGGLGDGLLVPRPVQGDDLGVGQVGSHGGSFREIGFQTGVTVYTQIPFTPSLGSSSSRGISPLERYENSAAGKVWAGTGSVRRRGGGVHMPCTVFSLSRRT